MTTTASTTLITTTVNGKPYNMNHIPPKQNRLTPTQKNILGSPQHLHLDSRWVYMLRSLYSDRFCFVVTYPRLSTRNTEAITNYWCWCWCSCYVMLFRFLACADFLYLLYSYRYWRLLFSSYLSICRQQWAVCWSHKKKVKTVRMDMSALILSLPYPLALLRNIIIIIPK